jgi:hypothetical protein
MSPSEHFKAGFSAILSWHPWVGLFIAILGLMGVLIPLVWEKIGKWAKRALTVLMFALLLLEMRSLRFASDDFEKDKKDQNDRFSEIVDGLKEAIATSQSQFSATMKRSNAIMRKTETAVAFISGGDSFPVVWPHISGADSIGFTLNKFGGYPLYGLSVFVIRPFRTFPPELNQSHGSGASVKIDEYNDSSSHAILVQPTPRDEVTYYSASMSARNGLWEEVIEIRLIDGAPVFRTVLFGSDHPGFMPNKKLLDIADQTFPAAHRRDQIYPLQPAKLPYDPAAHLPKYAWIKL